MYYYIANPAAGGGAIEDIQPKLRIALGQFDPDPVIVKTTGEGNTRQLVAQALEHGYKTIVVIGGDSTVREAISAVLSASAKQAAIGIIPIGKQNTLAAQLGIPGWQQAAAIVGQRRLVRISPFEVANRLCLFECRLQTTGKEALPYRIELDTDLTISGRARELVVYNQKLRNVDREDELSLQITAAVPGWRRRWQQLRASSGGDSRFTFSQLALKTTGSYRLMADGEDLDAGEKLTITKTDQPLALITGRPS